MGSTLAGPAAQELADADCDYQGAEEAESSEEGDAPEERAEAEPELVSRQAESAEAEPELEPLLPGAKRLPKSDFKSRARDDPEDPPTLIATYVDHKMYVGGEKAAARELTVRRVVFIWAS